MGCPCQRVDPPSCLSERLRNRGVNRRAAKALRLAQTAVGLASPVAMPHTDASCAANC